MVKYRVKGKTCDIRVDIPREVDEKTKQLILSTLQECLSSDYEKQALHEISRLMGDVNALVSHLKKDGLHDRITELAFRQLVGIYLQRGVHLGKHFEAQPDHVLKVIQMQHANIVQPSLSKLRGKKKKMAEYILQSLLIGKQCYEAGLSISAFMSMDKQKKFVEGLEKETESYIR
ncbi:hypothetical protein HYS54_00885 [Candidatus Micrarchaeota archaeon]|nr:hypothetical protein [Candidatus Micrarchaeota archaeon]